jgi:hypothetical protein
MPDPPGNQVKGVALRNFVQFTDRVAGPGAWDQVLARVDPEVAEAHRHGAIVSGGWYPLGWYAALHVAAEQAGLRAAPNFAYALGRESTRVDLSSGVYKLLLAVVSPSFLLGKAPLIFGSYYKQGAMTVTGATATHTRASWTGCVGFTAHIWRDIVGGCEGALVAAGARDVVLRMVSGGRDGDESAVADADWR